jgi:hypothetical protein
MWKIRAEWRWRVRAFCGTRHRHIKARWNRRSQTMTPPDPPAPEAPRTGMLDERRH